MSLKYYNNLVYEEIGENKDNIILFLHSKIVSKWIWIKQKEDYETCFNGYHCIFLDLPHHGKSQIEGEFSIEKSSKIIIGFLEDLLKMKENPSRINIVGLGIGGQIAMEILNQKPHLVDHLILSGMEIANEKEKKEDSIINRLAKTKAEYLNEKPDRFIVSAYLRYFGIKKDYYDFMEKDLDLRIKKEKEISFESLNYTLADNLDENIKNKENILLIYGNKEDLTCSYSAIKLKDTFKKAKLIEIEKGNHLWNLIDSDLFNKTVIRFIDKEEILEDKRIRILN